MIMTELKEASDEEVHTMWNQMWMQDHQDELGRFGKKFFRRLERGKTLRQAGEAYVRETIKAYVPWNQLTPFERVIERVLKEAFERWEAKKNGAGQTRH
jgi:hypothetical protein